jgi:hypothetical protein
MFIFNAQVVRYPYTFKFGLGIVWPAEVRIKVMNRNMILRNLMRGIIFLLLEAIQPSEGSGVYP